jgi:hypothetical protein
VTASCNHTSRQERTVNIGKYPPGWREELLDNVNWRKNMKGKEKKEENVKKRQKTRDKEKIEV